MFPVLMKTSQHVTLISSVLQLLWRVDVHGLFLKPYSAQPLTTHTHKHSATTHSLVPWCVVQSLLDNHLKSNHLKSNRSPVKKLHHRKIVHRNVGNVQLANIDKHCIETTLCKHFEMVVWMLHNKYYSVQTKVMEVLRRWIGRS